jgi:hypothetical protein
MQANAITAGRILLALALVTLAFGRDLVGLRSQEERSDRAGDERGERLPAGASDEALRQGIEAVRFHLTHLWRRRREHHSRTAGWRRARLDLRSTTT